MRNQLQQNREPLRIWLAFRLALLALPVFIGFLLPFSDKTPLPYGYTPNPNVLLDHLIRGWMRWDGGYYVDIAHYGYIFPVRSDDSAIAFFPLFPHLLRTFAVIFEFGNTHNEALYVAGIAVSTLASLACFVGLYRLALLDYDPETSRLSVAYLAAFPFAFFLLAVYTESLFIGLVIWAFWSARKDRWWWAGLWMGLAVLTKNQGILLVAALGLEYIYQRNFRRIDLKIFSFGLPLLAFGGWLLINFLNFGDPFRYIKVQESFARAFRSPLETLYLATQQFFTNRSPNSLLPTGYDTGSILYDYPVTFLFMGLLVAAGWLTWRQRLRLSYLFYFALCLLQPLTQPAHDTWLAGMPRFLLISFPAFLLLAMLGRRWVFCHYLYLGLSLPLLGLFLARFVLNYWVA